jgi:CYTH domain-containing protein
MNFESEIERKYFVRKMPDLAGIKPLLSERYFLNISNVVEERVTKIGDDQYFYEKKIETSRLSRNETHRYISKEEFDSLIPSESEAILRVRYDMPSFPKISIMVYKGRFNGLIRAEVEFKSIQEAESFNPPDWMGREMTDLPIARDAKLISLTREELANYLSPA